MSCLPNALTVLKSSWKVAFQHFLLPQLLLTLFFFKDDGISIPYSYTSFLGPIQSSKLYNEVRFCREKDKPYYTPFEMSYVVHFRNICELADPQALFTFVHPNRGNQLSLLLLLALLTLSYEIETPIDNTRYESRRFTIKCDSVLHGFAGYFETVLYKDVMLSINPATHSPGMFSWFPVMFPLQTPLNLKKVISFESMASPTGIWSFVF